MKKVGPIAALVVLVLVAASLVALVFLSSSSSHPFADPARVDLWPRAQRRHGAVHVRGQQVELAVVTRTALAH